jgi:hypothetical protein
VNTPSRGIPKRNVTGIAGVMSMKKPSEKKSAGKARKKAVKPAKRTPAPAATAKGGRRKRSGRRKRLLNKQPQVKQEAAVANGMFLYTDDAWSLRYFDQNDLHFKEREVFG